LYYYIFIYDLSYIILLFVGERGSNMKKKVAVMANGWNSENLSNFMTGLYEAVDKESVDFFVFLSYATYGYTQAAKKLECLSYDLPILSDFDAILIFGPGLNFQDVIENIQKKADETGIPVISIGIKHPGHYYIGAGNYTGMKELANHMIEEHGVKDILYIGGSRENEESNIRFKAIRDAAEEHGIKLGKNSIAYSDWESGKAVNIIKERYKSADEFPDAFMCANDQLAIAVDQVMESHYGLEPGEVKITGFDHLDNSKIYYPSISTVDQRYSDIGRKAGKVFKDLMNGKEPDNEITVDCKFIEGESCGCSHKRNAVQARRKYIRQLQLDSNLSADKEGRLFYVERSISRAQSYTGMKADLRDLLYNHPATEGDVFYIMFSKIMERIGEQEESMLPQFVLDDEYDVIVGKKNNVPVKAEKVNRRTLIPDYDPEGENMIYLVSMLRYENLVCGYFVMGNKPEEIKDKRYSNYQSRINRAFFTHIRNMQLNALNKRLADLMEQDALTHVKNRTAYNKYVRNFQNRVNEGEIKEYAVAYFDVNNLKVINDKYGHEAGDAYIRNSCKLICDTFKHSPVFRIGGDEFLSIIYNDDLKNKDLHIADMKKEMDYRASNPDKFSPAARVSVAMGVAIYDSSHDDDVMSVVNRADVLMYEEKFRMKNGDIR